MSPRRVAYIFVHSAGGTALLALPSPRVLLVGFAGLVVAGGTIGAWLRVRGSTVLRTTSTVFLVLSAVVNVIAVSVAMLWGRWMAVCAPGVPLALLCAEWRNASRPAADGLRSLPPSPPPTDPHR